MKSSAAITIWFLLSTFSDALTDKNTERDILEQIWANYDGKLINKLRCK